MAAPTPSPITIQQVILALQGVLDNAAANWDSPTVGACEGLMNQITTEAATETTNLANIMTAIAALPQPPAPATAE